jgi:hypothetical protein
MENNMYPLAHDESGLPLDVPPTATGWLVRRHAGGRGRPGAVYDGDGRPLVVPLDATLEDLRGQGCPAGSYRLDAVDGTRRPLGVAAYTELANEAGEARAASIPGNATDAAITALARAVEAMQRVQAERERMQAEMFMRLIERLSPAPVANQPANDLRNAVAQAVELKKTLDGLAGVDEDDEDDDEERPPSPLEMLAATVAPIVEALKYVKGEPSVPTHAAPATPRNGAAESPSAPPAEAELEAKMEAVLSMLTREEREQVGQLLKSAPPFLKEQAHKKLLSFTPEEAVAELRLLLKATGRAPQKAA